MTEQQRRPGRYPAEMRERAVRMVFEAEQHAGSRWAAMCSVADKLGPTPETIRKWVQRVEIDEGRKAGVTSDERERLKQLERENRELRRANEMAESSGERNGSCELLVHSPSRGSSAICLMRSRESMAI